MFNRPSSFRQLGFPALILLALLADSPPRDAPGAPAPKPKPYALLYIPKKTGQYETAQYRRRQIPFFKTNNAPFVLYWAIRSLKNTDLPSLPKKGRGEGKHDHDEDIAWLTQNLKVEYLDDTGALRVSLAAGSRREQAILVNATARAYFQVEVRQQRESMEENREILKRKLESLQQVINMYNEKIKRANVAQKVIFEADKKDCELHLMEVKASLEQLEAGLRALPQFLELADVPPE